MIRLLNIKKHPSIVPDLGRAEALSEDVGIAVRFVVVGAVVVRTAAHEGRAHTLSENVRAVRSVVLRAVVVGRASLDGQADASSEDG